MVKVAGYAAECMRDDWVQSDRLGQRPVRVLTRPAEALSPRDEFEPGGRRPGGPGDPGDAWRRCRSPSSSPT